MYTYEEQCVMDLSDNYTVLYSFLGRELLDAAGVEGERALREGTRRYGRDRGQCSRERHQALGVKINMQSLFSVGGDLPPDHRFHRELQELNSQERVSHTLVCPMADIWKAYGERAIGRIYCEEFHPACYNHYAYDCGHTNLAKTLTQEGDEYCAFNVVLRAENLPDDLKPLCFAEYDPGYVAPQVSVPKANGKRGFETLSVKLYYYLLEAAEEYITTEGSRLDSTPGDRQLIVMYAAYLYRKRGEESPAMPRMLRYALNNRLFSQKMKEADGLIMAGRIFIGELPADKAGTPVPADTVLTLREKAKKFSSTTALSAA